MLTDHLLSLAIWLPILGGVAVLATGPDARAPLARRLALAVSILTFLATLPLYTGFDTRTHAMQFTEDYAWIEALGIRYHLGIDGIALLLILLTSFSTVLVIVSAWQVIEKKVAQYLAAFLIMEGLMIGVFSALDAILFYVFWEAMLVPMFLIIGLWGGANRIYAAIKFFLYTFIGSVLMLVAFIYLYFQANSFEIQAFHALKIGLTEQVLIFLAFLAAFAVKGADVAGAYLVAGRARRGADRRFGDPGGDHAEDGCLRLPALLASDHARRFARARGPDDRAVAHRGGVHRPGGADAGGHEEAHRVFVHRAHGLRHARFLRLQRPGDRGRYHSNDLARLRVGRVVPVRRRALRPAALAHDQGLRRGGQPHAGVRRVHDAVRHGQRQAPGTSGFVGEFLVILGAFQVNGWYAFAAATTLVFGAAYTLWMYKRVIFGPVANEQVATLSDINGREAVFLAALAVAVLVMGLWPQPFLRSCTPRSSTCSSRR